MGIYSDIESHRGMIFDEVRNTAYSEAIKQVVTPTSRVLDLGAGLGIHGLLAALAGAREVILLDSSAVVELGTELARANGVSDQVRVIRKRIEEAEIDVPVDVIISVFTGNFLLTEDLLPSLISARNRFLKPGGILLPGKARMQAALVSAEAFHCERVARWSLPTLDISYEAVRRFAANGIYYETAEKIDAELLSEPVLLKEIDLLTAQTADCQSKTEIKVHTTGICHGILGWFDILLGERWLSTGPNAEPMHWSPAFLPLDPPIELQKGDVIHFELDRPEFGDWTWTIDYGTGHQRHSTFLAKPADMGFLKKQMDSFAPGLGMQGELAFYVLQQMKQGKTVSEILEGVRLDFRQLSKRDPGLKFRIRAMINQYGDANG